MKHQQDRAQKQNEDDEFLQWLSPSHWLFEAQLSSFREQRGENTLEWAINMPEFQTWRTSKIRVDSKMNERILWIRGPLGIGKSIMAGYFIDILKSKYIYPAAIVAYFFCRSGQAGLTKPRDIVRTLAYQCVQSGNEVRPEVRSVLENL